MISTAGNDRFPGKVPDSPSPTPIVGGLVAFQLVPQAWIDESEENLDLVVKNAGHSYFSHGVATASLSDQANSLSQSQREAAAMTIFTLTPDEEANFGNITFPTRPSSLLFSMRIMLGLSSSGPSGSLDEGLSF